MSLTPGTRLGPYELAAKLGSGGMGEVYRARDTKLGRDVAIKVLSSDVANDPERLGRFRREAQLLAALNHPNIAAIYGLEEAAGQPFLVLELVEGEDLSQRMARGRIPVDEAIAIAKQIVEALDEAHEKGIVHRDLKPANVKLRPDGKVKVLDFGLAKAYSTDASGGGTFDSGDSPTMTRAETMAGMILGTAAYMSPEQARGKPVDRRADIWAFGVVLYEMIAGKRLFDGDTLSDTLAAVLREEIDWSQLPSSTPASVRRLLARCLDRDGKRRLQAIGEARVALDDAATAPAARRRLWPVAAGLVVVALAVAYGFWQRGRPAIAKPTTAASSERSIAVLPFTNGSGSADDEYLADGMTDELIAGLGKVPGLHVAARSSAFAFKGKNADVREVAKRLGVATVLEGSLRRSGKRLRVTAALVSASDGLQLWSNTFESDGGDPFQVQDAVTRGVVAGLSLQLGGAALAASQAGRTREPEAHDLYLRGLSLANAGTEAGLRKGLELYKQALVRDPNFALAYAAIGWNYVVLADAYMPGNEAYPLAKAAALAAIERDPLVADAHAVLGYSLAAYDWDFVAAEHELKRALELDPNSSNSEFLFGSYLFLVHRTDEAFAHLDRAARLDPLSPLPRCAQEFCLYLAHRYDDVIAAHRKTEELAPGFWYFDSFEGASYRELGDYEAALRAYDAIGKTLEGAPQAGLAITYARMGRTDEARKIMDQLDARARTSYVPLIVRAAVHANLGDTDAALALLERSLAARETVFAYGANLPELAPLLGDPRARKLFDQVKPLERKKSGE